MKTIETERTVLRFFRSEDVDAVLSFMGNLEVMRFSLSDPYDRSQCEKFIEWCRSRYEKRGYGLFAVTLKTSKNVIGYCGFYDQNMEGRDEVELSYRLHPDYWNNGLGTEVAYAVQDYGFLVLGFDRLISIIAAENTPSIRVAEKNGMRHEKDCVYKDKVPAQIYSIKKEEHIKTSEARSCSRASS